MNHALVYSNLIGNLYLWDSIIYFDRPLVFILIDEGNNFYLSTITSFGPPERWLLCRISRERLMMATNGSITGYQTYKNSESGYLFDLFVYENGKTEVSKISSQEINDKMLPENEPCFENELVYEKLQGLNLSTYPAKYEQMLQNNDLSSYSISKKRNVIDFHLYDASSGENEVDLLRLGEFLKGIVNLSNSNPSTKFYGVKAPVWKASATMKGSFAIRVFNEDETLYSNEASTDSIISMINLFSSAVKKEQLLNQADYYDSNYINKFYTVLRNLAGGKIGLKMEYHSTQRYYRNIQLSSEEIERAIRWISQKKVETIEQFESVGVLKGFLNDGSKFVFTDDFGKDYVGNVAQELLNTEVILNVQRYKVTIQEMETNTLLNTKIKSSFQLNSIEKL